MITRMACSLGLERVLWIDQGVRVFAPQSPTRKGRVLGQLWYLPVSKTIIDCFEARHMEKTAENSVAMENLAVSKTHIPNL